MKKIKIVAIIGLTIFTLCACSNKEDKKIFNISKEAYDDITKSFELSSNFMDDIYTSWEIGVSKGANVTVDDLASKLHITKEEIQNGIVYCLAEKTNVTEKKIKEIDDIDIICTTYFTLTGKSDSDAMEACVNLIPYAYDKKGITKEIQEHMDNAKEQIKTLNQEYSDYEYYPTLKDYYTNVSVYFDFCQNPSGSFDQLRSTMNDYNNECKKYKKDLDIVFED